MFRRSLRHKKGEIIMALIILVMAGIFLTTGSVSVDPGEEEIVIDAVYWSDMTIPYTEIESMEYVRNLELGDRVFGYGDFNKMRMGKFRNHSFGDYTLYAYLQCKTHIILHTKDGIIAFNTEEEESTEALYSEILSGMSQ